MHKSIELLQYNGNNIEEVRKMFPDSKVTYGERYNGANYENCIYIGNQCSTVFYTDWVIKIDDEPVLNGHGTPQVFKNEHLIKLLEGGEFIVKRLKDYRGYLKRYY